MAIDAMASDNRREVGISRFMALIVEGETGVGDRGEVSLGRARADVTHVGTPKDQIRTVKFVEQLVSDVTESLVSPLEVVAVGSQVDELAASSRNSSPSFST